MTKYSTTRPINGHRPTERSAYIDGRRRGYWECKSCGETAETRRHFSQFECVGGESDG